ncbi:MAG: hypothetical protein VX589_20800, partial [Myxococcota bacterium]|nr:hypothetical protein [Myxococcota bacterium]
MKLGVHITCPSRTVPRQKEEFKTRLTATFLSALAVFVLALGGCTDLSTADDLVAAAQELGESQGESGTPASSEPIEAASEDSAQLDPQGLEPDELFDRKSEPDEEAREEFEPESDQVADEEFEPELDEAEPEDFGSDDDDWEAPESGPEPQPASGQDGDEIQEDDPADGGAPPTLNTSVNLPQVCVQSGVPPAGCECANAPGFKTYTFEHAGQQRCMTSYVDPQATNQPLPLIIRPNCYTSNALEFPDTEM